MNSPLIIFWFRRDLRLLDNPALSLAVSESREKKVPFLPLFILEEYMLQGSSDEQFGYPSRFFLAQALPALTDKIPNLATVRGRAVECFTYLAKSYELKIYVNDDVYQDFTKQVEKIKTLGIEVIVVSDTLSIPKDTKTKEGRSYSVFTPFKNNVWGKFVKVKTFPRPDLDSVIPFRSVKSIEGTIKPQTEEILKLFSSHRPVKFSGQVIDLNDYFPLPDLSSWYCSEDEALKRFRAFLKNGGLDHYDNNRNDLALSVTGKGTSKMSLALAWGLVSSRTLVSLIQKHYDEDFSNPLSLRVSQGALTYITELIWREFYRYLFLDRPELLNTEFQSRYRGSITWVKGKEAESRFIAWIKGETGYPLVDAAMMEIAKTGWMHNRTRMVVASILTKNLGVDWRLGQEYFRASLIDLDEASNNGGWQWAASVGADPKPIRIFNPTLQAKNYDKDSIYQNHWLNRGILQMETLPLVEHKVAREEALKRYNLK